MVLEEIETVVVGIAAAVVRKRPLLLHASEVFAALEAQLAFSGMQELVASESLTVRPLAAAQLEA